MSSDVVGNKSLISEEASNLSKKALNRYPTDDWTLALKFSNASPFKIVFECSLSATVICHPHYIAEKRFFRLVQKNRLQPFQTGSVANCHCEAIYVSATATRERSAQILQSVKIECSKIEIAGQRYVKPSSGLGSCSLCYVRPQGRSPSNPLLRLLRFRVRR